MHYYSALLGCKYAQLSSRSVLFPAHLLCRAVAGHLVAVQMSAVAVSRTAVVTSSAIEASSSSGAETADSCDHGSSLQTYSEGIDLAAGDDCQDDAVDERAP